MPPPIRPGAFARALRATTPVTHRMTVRNPLFVPRAAWSFGWEDEHNAMGALGIRTDAFERRFIARLRSLVEARA